MDQKEICVLIKHCFLKGKNEVQTEAFFKKYYKESAPSAATIRYWFAEFKLGHFNIKDGKRAGIPDEAVTSKSN